MLTKRGGKTLKAQGPLDAKTVHLLQRAAATTIYSEGGVHSHIRPALEHGGTPGEVQHPIILLTSTIEFPTVSTALSWAEDLFAKS